MCLRACVQCCAEVDKNQRRRLSKDDRDARDVDAELSSSPSNDERELNLPRIRNRNVYAQLGQFRRLLADSRERASQLELQLAKSHRLLDEANQRNHRCFADNDVGMQRGDGRQGVGGSVPVGKRNADGRLRDATRRLEETEKKRRDTENRLSAVLAELAATRESRQKLVDDLEACNIELENLRSQMTCGRDFRRHVELVRQLNEARQLNERLQGKLDDRRSVVTLTADGKFRRQKTAASERLAVTAERSTST